MTTNAPTHPLMQRPAQIAETWQKWRDNWEKADSIDKLKWLIISGFNVHCATIQELRERIIFYLQIADGYLNVFNFKDPDSETEPTFRIYKDNVRTGEISEKELRQELACKAFEILATHFFKTDEYPTHKHTLSNSLYHERIRHWHGLIFDETVFTALSHFYRAESESGRIHNLKARDWDKLTHAEEEAVVFLLKFNDFLWQWREGATYDTDPHKKEKEAENKKLRKRIEGAKLWMFEILATLRRLDVLEERIQNLDEKCLDKIKRIALRSELNSSFPVEKTRKVLTLNEAILAGNRAALFYMRCTIAQQEYKRLKELRDVEEAKKNLDTKAKELSAG